MLSATRVVFIGALSAQFAYAFSPTFTTPRQCESLRITWSESSLDLPTVDMPLSEVLFQLIPLDSDPSRIAPEPYTVSVPPGGHDIAALPFPAGTQFFASAHILGSVGFTRRTVSTIFTVEHSANSECLPPKMMPSDGRAKVKAFGKRQISVIGTNVATATGVPVPGPVNAIVSPSSGGAPPPINVIGVTAIPVEDSSSTSSGSSASATRSSSSPAASSSSGPVPPIRVIGTSNIPATGAPEAPGNAAPAPSSSGPVPPIQVIGTSFVTATGDAAPPAASSDESSAGGYDPSPTSTDSSSTEADATSTSCTDTPTALPVESETSEEMPPATITVPYEDESNAEDEEPCEESMDPEEHQSLHGTTTSSETDTATAYLPTATASANTEVVHYTVFDEMVNAANSMFKAWNPYMPAYTPSAGN